MGESATPSWVVDPFNGNGDYLNGVGGFYTLPGFTQPWGSPSPWRLEGIQDLVKANRFPRSAGKKNKGKGRGGKDHSSYSVITPGELYGLISPGGGRKGRGQVYSYPGNDTLLLPDAGPFSSPKPELSPGNETLEAQLRKMAKELEELKTLVQKQQQANKQNH